MTTESTLLQLSTQKPEFVNTARSRVYNYIRRQDRKYIIQVIEKDAYGVGRHRTHSPGIDSYIAVLACFCTGDTYKGHELDSVLTEPVVDIVCTCYCELVGRNSEQVKVYLNQKIVENEIVLQETLKIVMGELSARGLKFTQSHLIHLIHEAISHAAQNAAHTQLGMTVGHSITVAAGTTAGQILAHVLLKAIAQHVATVASHTAGNALVTAAVKTVAKKIVIVTITGVIVKTLATKFGIASAAAALHVIGLLFIGGYLTFKLVGLPEEMAKKVSNGVQDTLNDTYQSCLTEVLDSLAKSLQDPGKLASLVISEMTDSDMKGLQRDIEGRSVDVSDRKLIPLESEVNKDVGSVWGWISSWTL